MFHVQRLLRVQRGKSLTIGRLLTNSVVKSISVRELDCILKDASLRSQVQVVDVREPHETEIAKLSGSDIKYLPLSTANNWSGEILRGSLLDSSRPTYCICHHGMRSQKVAFFLANDAGFDEVYNVSGGIGAYSAEVDSSVPSY